MNRITVPWGEVYGNESPRYYQFKTNQSSATLVVEINAADLPKFIGEVLGYTRHTGPYTLSRRTPARHPAFPYMSAVSIDSCQGIKFLKDNQSDLGTLKNQFVPLARYLRERMTILFEPMPYNIFEDADIYGVAGRTEFDRYVTIGQVEPSTRVLTVNPGEGTIAFKWAEGPPLGNTIPFAVGQIVPEYSVVWTWHQVPGTALFGTRHVLGAGNQGGFAQNVPVNIQSCLGCVNDAEFGGYAAGTLLLSGVRLTPTFAPVQPALLGLAPLSPPMQYTVEYHCSMQPLGQNKAPYRGDGRWYYISTTGTMTGQPLYNPVDFNLLFQPL